MYEAINNVTGIIERENGLKMVRFENWSENNVFASEEIFCLGRVIKIVIIGAITKGNNIFKLGLNISFEAILAI